jgi:hypothetical protein
MTQMRLESIQPGWMMFVGSEEVGEVASDRRRSTYQSTDDSMAPPDAIVVDQGRR